MPTYSSAIHIAPTRKAIYVTTVLSLAGLALSLATADTNIATRAAAPSQTIPMVSEKAKLTGRDSIRGSAFGTSVAISGDTAVIGAVNVRGLQDSSAYVFVRDLAGNWILQQKLIPDPSSASMGGQFGVSVAISGSSIVVGANSDLVTTTSGAIRAGAAYVFIRDSSGRWSQQQRLTAAQPQPGSFGYSVTISGDVLTVGDPAYAVTTPSGTSAQIGAAYVFKRDSSGQWGQQQMLTASDAGLNTESFGFSASMSGDTLVIGNPDKSFITPSGNFNRNGAAYVFVRNSFGAWNQHQKLLHASRDARVDNRFGQSVSISSDTAVVGAWEQNGGSGAAYVFVRDSLGSWSLQQKLKGCDSAQADAFGSSVSISGNTIVAGAFQADLTVSSGRIPEAGAAYIFVRDSSDYWSQQQKISASDAAGEDLFGIAVAIHGDKLVVGANYDDLTTSTGTIADAGSAYVFEPAISIKTGDGSRRLH